MSTRDLDAIRSEIEKRYPKTLMHTLGIEVSRMDPDCVEGKMPVSERTHQPMGLLHGGAIVALAESLCSMGAFLNVDIQTESCVGIEINANHMRSEKSGWVYGCAKPVHLGRRTQVWAIEIKNEAGKMVSISRCTVAVVAKE